MGECLAQLETVQVSLWHSPIPTHLPTHPIPHFPTVCVTVRESAYSTPWLRMHATGHRCILGGSEVCSTWGVTYNTCIVPPWTSMCSRWQ